MKKYPFVSWFKILSQYDASTVFLLSFGMAMQYPYKFQKICYRAHWFLQYPERGNACALNIPMHKQYPFGSLDQNNLTHAGRAMQNPSKFGKICYEPNVFLG